MRPDQPLSRALLERDGFALWSAELVDDQGSGVSLTWGFGHAEARAGELGHASAVPSLALRVFALGERMFSLHQRFAEGAWIAPMGRWTFGESQIEALRDLNAQVIIARLNLKLPGSRARLEGHIELGAVPRRAGGEPEARVLDASPMTGPGEGRAILRAGGRDFHLQGRAAHARFGADAPRAFRWLRAPFPEEERWLVEDDEGARGFVVDAEGRSVEAALRREDAGVTTYWDGDRPFLTLEREDEIHARPLGGERLVRVRAPMLLPVKAILHTIQPGAAPDARTFVHHVGVSNPRRVLVENGLADASAWRRRFALSSR